jgi:uncharacterized protein with FMN-binding domain/NAD-dependent dihydropyrimidine dehydrogenase PreA subunit
MKKIQIIRLSFQLLCVLLSVIGFFQSFQVTMIIIMLVGIVGGAYYCGWICPYGTLQEIFGKLGNKIGIKKRKMPAPVQKYLQYLRYIIYICFALITSDIFFTLFSYDPRSNFLMLLSGNIPSVAILIIIISFVVLGMFFERPFCNYLCFEGVKYGAMSLLRVFTIKRNTNSCINCKRCDKVCPMNIQVSKAEQLRSPQCINCFECVSACPVKGTLTYGKVIFTQKLKRFYFVGIGLAILVVAFTIFEHHYVDIDGGSEKVFDDDGNVNINNQNKTATVIDSSEVHNDGMDGTYTGTAKGHNGDMTVEVTISSGQITKVQVVDHIDDAKWFNRANDVIPHEIISSQSTDVDAVSGATFSSQGIIDAVKNALESAK